MHKYASPSADSRELVAELEFVWDQVKSNVPSSSSSSPLQTMASIGMHHMSAPPPYPQLNRMQSKSTDDDVLRIRSPMSQSEEDGLEEEEAEDHEEFVDAPDSQYNPNTEPEAEEAEDVGIQVNLTPQPPVPENTKALIKRTAQPNDGPGDEKWKKRVEQALVKMTAEVAALREQLESRRLFTHSRRYKFFRWLFRFVWGSLKHIAVDIAILALILLVLRQKKDRRLEGAVRVLLGDAVAQVQKVGGAKMGKIQLPKLSVKKTSS